MFNLNIMWYQKNAVLWPLMPFTILYVWIIKFRRKLYQMGIFPQQTFPVPVIVVGNLTVGGTGKTPLVIHIVELLRKNGWRPGIVSAGYKGNHKELEIVYENSDPKLVGDEAIVLAKRLHCPMVVGKNRCLAVQQLLQKNKVDIVVSDDGLQHYALRRDIEIVVIDGQRRFGNGYCLPVGPLREPKNRLLEVDLIVNNGGNLGMNPEVNEYGMEYRPDEFYNALYFEQKRPLDSFRGKLVHVVTGIGNPQRFLQLLTTCGVQIVPHIYSDHYSFNPKDIHFKDDLPVLMTEKDVVKCFSFVNDRHWVLPIRAVVNPLFDAKLLTLVKKEGVCNG